jgi:hypothetical protein
MSMSRDNREKLIIGVTSAIIGALLGAAFNIGTLVWRQPYVQYGTSGAYINPKLGLGAVWLKHWRGAAAENVILTVSFTDPFTDMSTDQMDTPFKPSGGSSDKRTVMGTIERLEPGQQVTDPSVGMLSAGTL